MKVKSLSRVRLLATPWTAAHQAPPSMGFSRQEYWSGSPLRSLNTESRVYYINTASHFLKILLVAEPGYLDTAVTTHRAALRVAVEFGPVDKNVKSEPRLPAFG